MSKLSEELKEIYDGMIEDGTGFYDVVKIIGDAQFQAEQLEADNFTLQAKLAEAEMAVEQFEIALGEVWAHDGVWSLRSAYDSGTGVTTFGIYWAAKGPNHVANHIKIVSGCDSPFDAVFSALEAAKVITENRQA